MNMPDGDPPAADPVNNREVDLERHARQVRILTDWCLSRSPLSLELSNGHQHVIGPAHAAALNALPGRIVAAIRDTGQVRIPTDAELVDLFDAGLRRHGHRWDPGSETVQPVSSVDSTLMRTAPILMRIERLADHFDDVDDEPEDWDEQSGEHFTDCDWRLEDEFWAEDRRGLIGSEPSASGDPLTLRPWEGEQEASHLLTPRRSLPRRTSRRDPSTPDHQHVATLIGAIGQTITVSGTVVTAARVPPNRWNTKAQALLVLECGTARVKTVTSANWAYRVTPGEQVTLTGTVKAHTNSRGHPQTVLARPQRITPHEHASAETPGEVWEALMPALPKARPFPARPSHWPRRRAHRTHPIDPNTKESSDG